MAKIRFFDTSALQHRYVGGTDSKRVRLLTGTAAYQCVIAEATVLEMVSALATRCRGSGHSVAVFDRLEQRFFRDVASGRLIVRPTSHQEVLRARQLVRFAGVVRKRSISSGDALIAATCLSFALQLRSPITFYTSDWYLSSVLGEVDAFTTTLRLIFIGKPKQGIPAVSGCIRFRD